MIPNIGKVKLAENWWAIFTGQFAVNVNELYDRYRYQTLHMHMRLKANFEDGTSAVWSPLKCATENDIPYCVWDVKPEKNVKFLVLCVGLTNEHLAGLLVFEPPEGQLIMEEGKTYSFRLFLTLKEPVLA